MPSELPERSRSLAVLIGTATYLDPAFPDVPAAANSVARMRELLTDPDRGGWPADRVVSVVDPRDAVGLVKHLRGLFAGTDDTLLLYFAGHGVLTETPGLCLVLGDTEHDHPDITGLPWAGLRQDLLRCPATTRVVILDCCYSGQAIETLSGGDQQVADATQVSGVYTLTASDSFSTAHVVPADQQRERCTTFTEELLALVAEGVDGGPDLLTLQELYPRLRRRLVERGRPEPHQRGVDTADRFVLARNPAFRRERYVPPAGWPDAAAFGSAEDFVAGLTEVRRAVGATQRELSDATGGSLSTGRIGRILNSEGLPRPWTTVELYLAACGAPPAERTRWQQSWERLRREVPAAAPAPGSAPDRTRRWWLPRQG